VEDDVALGHEEVDGGLVGDGAADELEAGALAEGGDVVEAAGGEVVEDGDAGAGLAEEALGEVGADEAGAAGDAAVLGGGVPGVACREGLGLGTCSLK
jgi:hypothetical protein